MPEIKSPSVKSQYWDPHNAKFSDVEPGKEMWVTPSVTQMMMPNNDRALGNLNRQKRDALSTNTYNQMKADPNYAHAIGAIGATEIKHAPPIGPLSPHYASPEEAAAYEEIQKKYNMQPIFTSQPEDKI